MTDAGLGELTNSLGGVIRPPMSSMDKVQKLMAADRTDDALRVLDAMAESPETRHEALGHRGWLLITIGRYEEAQRDFEEVCRADPQDLNAAAHLARTLMGQGKLEEGARRAVEILQRDAMNPLAMALLRECQAKSGVIDPFGGAGGRIPVEGIPTRPLNPAIELLETHDENFPTSVYPQIGRFLYAITLCCRPRMVVETGCFIGYSTLCIAQALEDGEQGHLHSFDLFLENPEYVSPVVGECSDTLRAARAHVEKAGLAHRVTLHRGDSSSEMQRLFGEREGVIDMAFIDGDHTIKGCMRDWEVVDSLLVEGGVILLHDTLAKNCRWMGPQFLLEKLGAHEPERYHWINLPTLERIGLGIVQKRRSGDTPHWKPTLIETMTEWFHLQTNWGRKARKRAERDSGSGDRA
jgi:predicted O-methyltransferase YrrM